jgi:hypothetical protein
VTVERALPLAKPHVDRRVRQPLLHVHVLDEREAAGVAKRELELVAVVLAEQVTLGLEARAHDVEPIEKLVVAGRRLGIERPVRLEPHLVAEQELHLVLTVVGTELEAAVVLGADGRLLLLLGLLGLDRILGWHGLGRGSRLLVGRLRLIGRSRSWGRRLVRRGLARGRRLSASNSGEQNNESGGREVPVHTIRVDRISVTAP